VGTGKKMVQILSGEKNASIQNSHLYFQSSLKTEPSRVGFAEEFAADIAEVPARLRPIGYKL